MQPEIGMGVTEHMYSDRHAYTIVLIHKSGKKIRIQQDKAKRIDKNGMSDQQEYEYTPNPDGRIYELSLRKNGEWRKVGVQNGSVFGIGYRREYYDYSY